MRITEISVEGYEKVVHGHDPHSGLRAFISVHDTSFGPALGGLRMWPYPSAEEALADANALSRGMSYKSAVAATGLGGGKAVIIGDPMRHKSEALLRAMGRFIDTLEGLYITAEDVGMSVDDMVIVRQETRHVTGLPRTMGSSGNPAPLTAFGVFLGMSVCLARRLHTDQFKGVRIAIQGCGNVASFLCHHLYEAGARLTVTDVNVEKAKTLAARYGASVVAPEAIYEVDCDLFAPCALGGTLNDQTIPRLTCPIVAGSANNQCLRVEHGDMLQERGILYAPDFVINAGGVINIAVELSPEGYRESRAKERVRHIAQALHNLFDLADRHPCSTQQAALMLADQKLAEARAQRQQRGRHARPQTKTGVALA